MAFMSLWRRGYRDPAQSPLRSEELACAPRADSRARALHQAPVCPRPVLHHEIHFLGPSEFFKKYSETDTTVAACSNTHVDIVLWTYTFMPTSLQWENRAGGRAPGHHPFPAPARAQGALPREGPEARSQVNEVSPRTAHTALTSSVTLHIYGFPVLVHAVRKPAKAITCVNTRVDTSAGLR
ncbi:hypothetical protein MDA_GLEAN10016529 [Myotis davidii]|uniref:Uncharacterized protein n=1 Tax=Myotis davidii TaxID=225400 RepID=L5LPA1_MYODS|nr:hypothetical protein MDA_GLEAN10016529 [Myotis davidii]